MVIEDNASDLSQDFALLEAEPEVELKDASEDKTKPPKSEVKEVIDEPEIEEVDEEKAPEKEEEVEEELLPHQRPTMEQIKKVYPDLFKKFPALQASFNRERQFSEVFSTPADAKEAAARAGDYEDLRNDVVNGDGSKFIPALKESDSLGKFAKSFLPNLYKADKDTHWQVILPIIEDMVRLAYKDGTRTKNENLSNSALHMAEYLLGDMSVAEGKKTFVEKLEEKVAPNKEIQEYENRRFNDFNIDVHESLYNSLITEIDKGFKSEDGLTDFMKESVRKAAIDEVVKAVKEDKEFGRFKDDLWKKAKANGYRNDDKTRILNASLARAKSLIPGIRRKLIGDALGSSPLEADKKRDVAEKAAARREPGSSGRESTLKGKIPNSKQIDFKKTTDMDILNDKYTLKGQK